MSLIKVIRAQLGLSTTPANNFTWDASADNGTAKLARGNAGATTQDIMTVDAAGKVAFPQQGQSLTINGYVKLPGGLIVQWGLNTAGASGPATYSFPIPFPNDVFVMTSSNRNPNAGAFTNALPVSASQFSVAAVIPPSTFAPDAVQWIAIGY